MTRGVPHVDFPHGTTTGYWIHMRGNKYHPASTPCDECRTAQAAYKKKRYYERKRLRGAVEPSHTTPALGTLRRIEALMRMGWTAYDIGAIAFPYATRESQARLIYRVRGKQRIQWRTALAVNKAYRELQFKRGPSDKTARWASKMGYAAPGCWDNIDDPEEEPKGVAKWKQAA